MYRLKVKDYFAASHRLPWHEGKCKAAHGHTWHVVVVVESDGLDEHGIVMDFAALRYWLKIILAVWDHGDLNEHFVSPTAENIAEKIAFEMTRGLLQHCPHARVAEVEVWEAPNAGAIYVSEEEEDEGS